MTTKECNVFVENEAYRPFKYQWAVNSERKQRIEMHWHEGQAELQDDLRQYNSEDGMKTANVSHAVNKSVLTKSIMIFTEMDVAVGTGYTELLPYVKNNEIRTLWMTQAAREVTHQRAYALAAETFGFHDESWVEFNEYSVMRSKIDVISQKVKDLHIPLNFCKKLAILLLGEGIALFGAFGCLLNQKRFGLMMGFNVINEWSLKDEGEHVQSNINVLLEIMPTLSKRDRTELISFINEIVEMYRTAEHNFIDVVFELGDQEGMSAQELKGYIDYLCQYRKYQIGLIPESELIPSTLPWMDYILSAQMHSNFFETKVTSYVHRKLEGEIDYSKFKYMAINYASGIVR